jgi:zinc protease
MLAMRTVGPRSIDFPALEALSGVLSSQRFDLYGLVPEGKAIDATFELEPLPTAGVAYATLSFTAGTDAKALEGEVRAILARVARDGVPADLVDAVKLQERTAAQLQRNSILISRPCGPMRSLCTTCNLRMMTWRESRA